MSTGAFLCETINHFASTPTVGVRLIEKYRPRSDQISAACFQIECHQKIITENARRPSGDEIGLCKQRAVWTCLH